MIFHTENIECLVCMDVKLDRNNTHRHADVAKMSVDLCGAMCSALLEVNAFTGYDYTSTFCIKTTLIQLIL